MVIENISKIDVLIGLAIGSYLGNKHVTERIEDILKKWKSKTKGGDEENGN